MLKHKNVFSGPKIETKNIEKAVKVTKHERAIILRKGVSEKNTLVK